MRRVIMLALAMAACSQPDRAPLPVKPGMTERQVVEVSDNRAPDRIILRTCGNETAAPFPCKIYVYDGAWREGRYHPKLSVVFEEVRGQWRVSQWL
jgi:hypothetical protein